MRTSVSWSGPAAFCNLTLGRFFLISAVVRHSTWQLWTGGLPHQQIILNIKPHTQVFQHIWYGGISITDRYCHLAVGDCLDSLPYALCFATVLEMDVDSLVVSALCYSDGLVACSEVGVLGPQQLMYLSSHQQLLVGECSDCLGYTDIVDPLANVTGGS